MIRWGTTVALLLGSMTPVWAAEGEANPERIARRCHFRIRMTVRHFGYETRHKTGRCVRMINRLQEEGLDDEAAQVAGNCADAIGNAAEATEQRILNRTQQCVNALVELQAPEDLVAALQEHSERAIAKVQTIKERSLEHLDQALNGD